MTRREVIYQAMSGKITWIAAAEILRMSPRNLRRLHRGFERWGVQALYDRRRLVPSLKRASAAEVEGVLQLYRERYSGFNVRHFHELAAREHEVKLSYSLVKRVLQEAGLVRRQRARGRHRQRREPRACLGEMLQLDGSRHEWLALRPAEKQTLIAAVDDATKRVFYAQLWPSEDLQAVLSALREILVRHGIPMAIYTDRASWAAYTPRAGGAVDQSRPTEFGRILHRLGIEHILSYSPQARGRIERLNRTFQDRLVNELRAAGIDTVEQANRYINEGGFLERHNRRFERAPANPDNAFLPLGKGAKVDELLGSVEERIVGRDNVVSFEGVALQIAKQRGRRSCAGLRVTVNRHFDGSFTVSRAENILGRFDLAGQPRRAAISTPPPAPGSLPGPAPSPPQ
jgi:transposase